MEDPGGGISEWSISVSGERGIKDEDDTRGLIGPVEMLGVMSYWRLFRTASGLDIVLMLLGTLGAVINGLSLPALLIVQSHIYNKFGRFQTSSSSPASSTSNQITLYIYIGIIAWFAAYLQVSCWVSTGERQVQKLRMQYLASVLRQDVEYFDCESTSGNVIEDLSHNLLQVQEAIGEKLGNFIYYVFTFIGGCLVGVILIWRLVLVLLPFSVLLIVPGILYARVLSTSSRKNQMAYAAAGDIANQAISSVRVVYAFGGEKQMLSLYSASLEKIVRLEKSQGLAKGLARGAKGLTWLVWAFIIWHGSKTVSQGHGNGGQVLCLGIAFVMGSKGLAKALENIQEFSDGHAALGRILGVIAQKPSIDIQDPKGEVLENSKGNFRLQNVTFSYPSRPTVTVLQSFNLHIHASKTTAIVGSSGSGKSTIVALLERFYNPQEGRILLDGIDIHRLNLKWYRDRIGLVSQQPSLFSTSIKENILLGRQAANMEEVISAAKKANAHNFIAALPQEYETQVGEHGIQLSGGQKQRIAIARAIMKRPLVMLLDEATSALDNESEKMVQEALDRTCQDLTTVTIAHRVCSLRNADYIAVMDSGKVVDFGKQGKYSAARKVHSKLWEAADGDSGLLSGPQQQAQHFSNKSVRDVTGAEKATETKRKRMSLLYLLKFSRTEWKQGCFALLCTVVCGLIDSVNPIVNAVAASAFYTDGSKEVGQIIKVATGLSFGCAVILFASAVAGNYFLGIVKAYLALRIRESMLTKILQFEVAWFDREENSPGAICSRLATDAATVRSLIGDKISLLLETFTTMLVSVTISFMVSWKLAAVVTALLPLIGIAAYLRVINLKAYSKRSATMQQKVSQVAIDAVSQHRTVTAYCLQNTIMDMLKPSLLSTSMSMSQVGGMSSGLSLFVLFSCYSLSIWYGGRLLAQHEITFRDFLITYSVLIYVGRTLVDTIILTPDLAASMVVGKSLMEIIERPVPSENLNTSTGALETLEGRVEFRNVSFAYPSRRDVLVLDRFSFIVHPGQCSAIVGSSGSGKSTVVALLERFYEPASGSIMVDGRDISKLNLAELRKQIGLVSQEPTLFAMSIRDNITFGNTATDAEVYEAARVANVHTFVSALPDGYSTYVGEGGTQLSGGQKQRIAIARAVLRNPRILLLDEATSALDGDSEKQVQEALDKLMVSRTSIVIAHRLSTIKDADTISVMQNGVIVEQGCHEDLLSKGKDGAYYRLVHSQLDS